MSTLSTFVRRCATPVAAVVAALSLSSCGGGDPYTGLWEGTRDGQPVQVIMLGDGTYYMQYPGPAGSISNFGGLIRGSGEFKGATFKSDDGIDFQFTYLPYLPTPTKITAKIGGHQTVTGTVNGKPLQLKYVKPFDPHGALADLAGSYPGDVVFFMGPRQTTFDVSADGSLRTELNGCSITGQVVPRYDDAFDLTVKFGPAPCLIPYLEFKGAAIYSPDLQQLEAAVVNETYAQAITFKARKTD